MTQELIRSGYDIDGIRVEVLFDDEAKRFTIATRWVNLTHFDCWPHTERANRLALDQALASFEVVCMDGATKEVARRAKAAARSIHPRQCTTGGYEREVLRRAA
ncbi:hypothetical protein [Herbaspirillum seropedicae]|uniref:hypothetical protein n=1 Tax=Herbaspirillum seropedicae TaxID=964 RepID=UPI003FCDAD36